MKQFIVLISSVLLGLAIYVLILGDEGSIKAEVRSFWENEIQQQSIYP